MPDRNELAGRIRELREKARLTQKDLAELSNVSIKTVHRWEFGERIPRANEIQRIAAALHVSEAELLNGPGRKEFEVKILMGVKDLGNMAGLEVADNCFLYGVQDDKPQIHLAGKVLIGTPEEREAARELINRKFDEACWMFDHKGKSEAVGA